MVCCRELNQHEQLPRGERFLCRLGTGVTKGVHIWVWFKACSSLCSSPACRTFGLGKDKRLEALGACCIAR